jgi:hypothetical protein
MTLMCRGELLIAAIVPDHPQGTHIIMPLLRWPDLSSLMKGIAPKFSQYTTDWIQGRGCD